MISGIKYLVLGVLFLSGLKPTQAQQNIQFTQYIFNSLSVNPAYVGYKEECFAQLGLRSQWTVCHVQQTSTRPTDGQRSKYWNIKLLV